MASLNLCPQFENNFMSYPRVIELLLQFKGTKPHGNSVIAKIHFK